MTEHDPFPAEFAALRAGVTVTPPGIDAAYRWVRRRRRTRLAGGLAVLAGAVGGTVLAFLVTAGAGAPLAGTLVSRPSTAATPAPSPVPSSAAFVLPVPTSHACDTDPQVRLSGRSGDEVIVEVDGGYRVCPGGTVRVSWASYTVDSAGTQRLYRSGSGTLTAQRDTLALTVQTPVCGRYTLYVISGSHQPPAVIAPSAAPTRVDADGVGSGQLVYALDTANCVPSTSAAIRPALPMR